MNLWPETSPSFSQGWLTQQTNQCEGNAQDETVSNPRLLENVNISPVYIIVEVNVLT